jgi:hypothetical protein
VESSPAQHVTFTNGGIVGDTVIGECVGRTVGADVGAGTAKDRVGYDDGSGKLVSRKDTGVDIDASKAMKHRDNQLETKARCSLTYLVLWWESWWLVFLSATLLAKR